MHYFFQSEKTLHTVFEQCGSLIKKGGYFIGTTIDGKKIIELLGKNTKFESMLLSITKKYTSINPTKKYGNQYTFKINDSFDQGNYFNTMGESTEYLVNLDELVKVAGFYGFEPMLVNYFELKLGKKDTFTSSPSFVSFEHIYRQNFLNLPLSPEEEILNSLYTTFVFKKR
jgi:hypothetical protein